MFLFTSQVIYQTYRCIYKCIAAKGGVNYLTSHRRLQTELKDDGEVLPSPPSSPSPPHHYNIILLSSVKPVNLSFIVLTVTCLYGAPSIINGTQSCSMAVSSAFTYQRSIKYLY